MKTTRAHGSYSARGQIMPLFALTILIFFGAAMLGVDLSRLRAETENVQRAANAAALAGVVFLPDFKSNAVFRAQEEATKNGFTDGKNGVTLNAVPVNGNRMQVTISEPVPLIFGPALGIASRTVTRSATAEYSLPLEMGSPDYVLGYPFFPSKLTDYTSDGSGTTVPEGYYLEERGNYGFQDNGDAYSSYLESFPPSGKFATTSGTGVGTAPFANPSACGPDPTACGSTAPNPDRASVSFTGYDYIIDNPNGATVVLKLFDPYDESRYYDEAYDNGRTGAPLSNLNILHGLPALGGNYQLSTGSNRFVDSDSPGVKFSNTGSSAITYTTALQWSLYGPGQLPTDPTMKQVTATADPSSAGSAACGATVDCVTDPNLVTGNDPAYTTLASCLVTHPSNRSACNSTAYNSHYAYQFMNYAVIHGKGVYRLHVNATANPDGTYGTDGNMFGLAVCSPTSTGGTTLGTLADPSDGGSATADPYNDSTGWTASSCYQPDASTCPNPNMAQPGTCVHIYGLGRMCIFNSFKSGTAVIPLGYVPAQYAGKSLTVRLYDVGDVGGTSGNYIQPLTPAGDAAHRDGTLNTDGGTVSPGYPSALSYTFNASPTDSSLASKASPGYPSLTGTHTQTSPGDTSLRQCIGNGCGIASQSFQGSWLSMHIPIPSASSSTPYATMVKDFGGYWKMYYNIGSGGSTNDTTTWEISVAGSPVHLVQ